MERTTEDRKVTCSIQVSDTHFCPLTRQYRTVVAAARAQQRRRSFAVRVHDLFLFSPARNSCSSLLMELADDADAMVAHTSELRVQALQLFELAGKEQAESDRRASAPSSLFLPPVHEGPHGPRPLLTAPCPQVLPTEAAAARIEPLPVLDLEESSVAGNVEVVDSCCRQTLHPKAKSFAELVVPIMGDTFAAIGFRRLSMVNATTARTTRSTGSHGCKSGRRPSTPK